MCTLDGLNAEHKFRVWVTILGRMSRHFHFHRPYTVATLRIIVEQSIEWNSSLYVSFVEYEFSLSVFVPPGY